MAIKVSPKVFQKRRASHSEKTLPHLFGRGGRDRALISLAMNGPMTVRELGRAIGSDSHKTWNMVEVLKRSGLVVKRERAGGRKYVAINRASPIYDELMALLRAMDKYWPAKRVSQPRYRWAMWNDKGAITDARLAEMFYSPVRSKTLLFVACAGVTNLSMIYISLKLGSVSAMYAVGHWERQGVIRSIAHRRHRLITLDEQFPVAGELHTLLEALVKNSGYYQRLGRQAQATMEQIKSGWVKPPRDANGRLRYRLKGR